MTDTYQDPAVIDEWSAIFERVAGEDGHISRAEFQQCLAVQSDYLAERIFDLFDEDDSGTIEYQEFLKGLSDLLLGGREAKLDFAFRLHDRDGNGAIDREELTDMIQASLEEAQLSFSAEQTEALVHGIFTKADADGNGEISLEEFRDTLNQYPDVYAQMSLSAAAWLAPLRGKKLRRRKPKPPKTPSKYVEPSATWVVFLVLYGASNAAFFIQGMVNYSDHNIFVMVARGCGACLNFNGALILIPMMRLFVTWLRRTKVFNLLPLDQSIDFHRIVGHVMFWLSIVHTVAHFANYTTLNTPVWRSALTTKAGLTGVLLLLVFAIMWYYARDSVRRKGGFERFYFTHYLFALWFLLALLHGPRLWMWATIPLLGYAAERILRAYREATPSYVESGTTLPGEVTRLAIRRPEGFEFQPGDYVFILIPEISRFEWHPFTISSAPEEPDVFTLHVRSLGNWTRALHSLYEKREEDAKPVRVHIDGPYGTPSTNVFNSKRAVLIGAGIGVTPFASILSSLLRRRQAGLSSQLEQVHFYWVNRGQRSFDWFTDLLGEIEENDVHDIVDINIYLSNAKMDLKSTTLNIAMDLSHAETGRDLITGLKLRTHLGRPDWPEIFAQLRDEHGGDSIDVYFCGPAGLSRQLRAEAEACGFTYRKENF